MSEAPEATPQTPEGLLRQVFAEVRGLRAEVAELKAAAASSSRLLYQVGEIGVYAPNTAAEDGAVAHRPIGGGPVRYLKGATPKPPSQPQERGGSDAA